MKYASDELYPKYMDLHGQLIIGSWIRFIRQVTPGHPEFQDSRYDVLHFSRTISRIRKTDLPNSRGLCQVSFRYFNSLDQSSCTTSGPDPRNSTLCGRSIAPSTMYYFSSEDIYSLRSQGIRIRCTDFIERNNSNKGINWTLLHYDV
jgi:hypothetical protein